MGMRGFDIAAAWGAMPVAVMWRHARSIALAVGLMWGSIWWFAGPFVQARADDALFEMLKRQGMSPEDFKAMQDQLRALDIDVTAIRKDTANTNAEIEDLQRKLDNVDAKAAQTYDLLKTLIPMIRAEMGQP